MLWGYASEQRSWQKTGPIELELGLGGPSRKSATEPPWVSWRLGGLDLRGDDGLALLMVVEAVDPSEQVPLRGETGRR
jgi:hypothetical protein